MTPVANKDAAGQLFSPTMNDLPPEQEAFLAAALDCKLRPIGKPWLVALGTTNTVTIHPRDVFREAIKRNAVSIIVSHNHPSGEPIFSLDDRELTGRLTSAGQLLGIPLTDHILLADTVVSWEEQREKEGM